MPGKPTRKRAAPAAPARLVQQIHFSELDGFLKEHAEHFVIVDFTAKWCPPCKLQHKVLNEVASTLPEGIPVEMIAVDVDEDEQRADKLGIEGIPAIRVWRNCEPVDFPVDNERRNLLIGTTTVEELTGIINWLVTA
jgi:thioredoxin 1